MSDFQQNRVSATVWPWATSGAARTSQKTGLPRQAKALIQCVVMLLIAWFLRGVLHHVFMSKVVITLAAVVLVSGLFIPPVFNAIERGGRKLGAWAATGLTWLLLVPFFYLVFVPGRAFQALRGVDPLHRRFPTGDPTYWYPRPSVRDPEQYRKQH